MDFALTCDIAFLNRQVIVAVIDAHGRAKARQEGRGQCMNPVVAAPINLRRLPKPARRSILSLTPFAS